MFSSARSMWMTARDTSGFTTRSRVRERLRDPAVRAAPPPGSLGNHGQTTVAAGARVSQPVSVVLILSQGVTVRRGAPKLGVPACCLSRWEREAGKQTQGSCPLPPPVYRRRERKAE